MNRIWTAVLALALVSCTNEPDAMAQPAEETPGRAAPRPVVAADAPFVVTPIATLREPWALAFLPDGRLLVTEKSGRLRILTPDGEVSAPVEGVPEVSYGGQGGLGDVVLHPGFEENRRIYLSYAEAGPGGRHGAAVARARLVESAERGARLEGLEVIWRQDPKVSGRGHYGHRLAFSPGGHLFLSSGDRQKFDPAQDMGQNLGKILRLKEDGRIPEDNPFADRAGVAAQVWSLGHRNPLGLAFDARGRLWNHEMGPAGGDELNLVERGANYGYPVVSNGDHYDGQPIPDHPSHPEFSPPALWWTPVISPSGLIFYSGKRFPDWDGDALISSLSARALIRVRIEGDRASEVARYVLGERIRAVAQGPGGDVWLLEDRGDGRLLRLSPR